MLRRVTALSRLGASHITPPSESAAEYGLLRRAEGRSFTEFNRRRPGRSSAASDVVMAVWNIDFPPEPTPEPERLVPISF
jgi:hypothetical protein